MKTNPLFSLGMMVATRAVADAMEGAPDTFGAFAKQCMRRHRTGDWGDMTEDDKAMNDEAVRQGNLRIFSAYENPNNPEWNHRGRPQRYNPFVSGRILRRINYAR